MPLIRHATAEDVVFLQEMLAFAADWRTGAPRRSVPEIMAEPALAHYIAGWRTEGDVGFVAEEGRALGAAWWRFFSEHDPGYGFVDEATPEVAIGLVENARGRGVGTLLLQALISEAQASALPALSLSVDSDNPAAALYRRLGFVTVARSSGSLKMLRRIVDQRPRS